MIAARAHDWDSFRARARGLLAAGVAPSEVAWSRGDQPSLFDEASRHGPPDARAPTAHTGAGPRVPASLVTALREASDHRDPSRFDLFYRLVWRATRDELPALDDPLDRDVVRLTSMLRDLRHEEHRMHAFVRFRRVTGAEGQEHWVAWYAPEHDILARVVPFFVRRYPSARWSLLTPTASAHYDGRSPAFGPGVPRSNAPGPDELDALFLTYYEAIFNPARAKVGLLHRHMPRPYRAQVPEAAEGDRLAREAPARLAAISTTVRSAAEALLPSSRELGALAAAACACRACPIGAHATQTVFGRGPHDAALMVVGEQPGDKEDRAGRPFVGPSGRLLDELFREAGVPRDQAYVTNAVKHFKWEPRGKRRLHAKPSYDEVVSCRAWLLAEVDAIKPALILCLGATAAQSFCGPGFRIKRDRGKPSAVPWAPWWMATYHPSALLRAPDEATRQAMRAEMLADLRATRDRLRSLAAGKAT